MAVCLLLTFLVTAPEADAIELNSLNASINENPLWFDSLNVRFIGNWPFGFPEEVCCSHTPGFVFLGLGGGVYVMNVEDPTAPYKINEQIHTRGLVRDLCLQDSLLYIACYLGGLEIWDVTDLYNPVRLCCYQTIGYVNDVDVLDTIACITNDNCIRLLNIVDPVNPHEVGICSTTHFVNNVAINQNYAFISNWSDTGIHVIDISDPTNPFEVGFCIGYGATNQIVIVNDTLAYVSDYRFRVFNFSDPTNPYQITNFNPTYSIRKFALSDTIMYVGAGFDGFAVVNLVDILNPQTIGYYGLYWLCLGVAVSDSIAYVANRYNSLWTMDVSDPTAPLPIEQYNTPSSARDVIVFGGLAYVGQLRAGLYILDVQNPSSPHEYGRCDTNVTVSETALDGGYAYAACLEDTGLMIFDVSNPAAPYVTGFHSNLSPCGVDKENEYAYVAGGFGLYIYDVSDPYNPSYAGFHNSPPSARGVDVIDTFAYLANDGAGLRIINVSNPSSPYEVGFYDTPGGTWRATVAGNYAYVADGVAGLRVIDVSVPSNPQEVGFYDTPGKAEEVAISGDYAYVADGTAGVRVIDISDPTNPYEVGHYTTPEYAKSVYAILNYIYVGCYNCGIQIYQNTLIDIEEKNSTKPVGSLFWLQNPAKGDLIKVTLKIDQPSAPVFALYNTLGQKVKEYSLNKLLPGEHVVILPVKGLPSGVYFLQLETAHKNVIKKVIVFK